MIKEISEQKSLEARGLFALAQKHYRIVRDCERMLAEIVESDDEFYAGCISDEIYDDNGSFDVAMKKHEIKVVKPKPAKRRR